MDDELLARLYQHLFHGHITPDPTNVPRRAIYSDAIIALIVIYATLRDRSGRWACQRTNWPPTYRHALRRLPSYSQFCRRRRSASVLGLIEQLNVCLRERLGRSSQKAVDGKPLLVGGFSKDPDAMIGRSCGGRWARGYKLHVIVDSLGGIDAFAVSGLNAGESTVAREQLVDQIDLHDVLMRGDGNYDSNPLYDAMATRGGRLIAPRRKPGRGLSKRQHHPDRLRAIAELESPPDHTTLMTTREAHDQHRLRVEQILGHLTNLPCGLAPLPNFVRRLPRVRQWVTVKVLLYHACLAIARSHHCAAA